MITWLILKTGWSPLVVKLLLAGLIAAGILLCLQWYGNRQYYEGEKAGRIYEAKAIETAKKKEWAAKETAIAQAAADLTGEKYAVKAAAETLAKDRANLSRALNEARAAIQQERIRQYADASSTPDDVIWRDIRILSGQLAADTR